MVVVGACGWEVMDGERERDRGGLDVVEEKTRCTVLKFQSPVACW